MLNADMKVTLCFLLLLAIVSIEAYHITHRRGRQALNEDCISNACTGDNLACGTDATETANKCICDPATFYYEVSGACVECVQANSAGAFTPITGTNVATCVCNTGFDGDGCAACATNYYPAGTCDVQCDPATTCNGAGTCANDGSCTCNTNFDGAACDACVTNFYPVGTCDVECDPATTCSGNGVCGDDGTCTCNTGFDGTACDACATNYYPAGTCDVLCDPATTCTGNGVCGDDGTCDCSEGHAGADCSDIAPGGDCQDDSGCTGANQVCNELKKCGCKEGYVQNAVGVCVENKVVAFVVPLVIDIAFDTALNDPSSSAFINLAATLVEDLTDHLCEGLTANGQTCIVVIVGFSDGSTRRRTGSTNVETEVRVSGGDVDESAITDAVQTNAAAAKDQTLTKTGVDVSDVKTSEIVATSKVGLDCSSDATVCTGAGQTCTEGKCACDATKYATVGDVCEEKTAVGAACPNGAADCTGDNQVCTDEKCACDATHAAADGQCTLGLVGAACEDATGCSGDNIECASDSKECACVANYKSALDKSCVEDKPQEWYFELTINKDWDEKLGDTTSDEFKARASTVETYCTVTLGMCGKFPDCEVKVVFFKSGSQTATVEAKMTGGEAETKQQVQNDIAKAPDNAIDGDAVAPGTVSLTNFDECAITKCAENKGDCDTDEQCEDGLKCGMNNCPAGSDPLADCCFNPKATDAPACDGQGINMWSCCSEDNKCGADEGDCDSNAECQDGLVCGRNSCSFTIPEGNEDRFFPTGQADCCMSVRRSLFYGIPTKEDLSEDGFRNAEEPGF